MRLGLLAQLIAGIPEIPPDVREKDGMERTVRALDRISRGGTLELQDFRRPDFLGDVQVVVGGERQLRPGFWRGLNQFLEEIRGGRRAACVTQNLLDALGERLTADEATREVLRNACRPKQQAEPPQPAPPEPVPPPPPGRNPDVAAPVEDNPPQPIPTIPTFAEWLARVTGQVVAEPSPAAPEVPPEPPPPAPEPPGEPGRPQDPPAAPARGDDRTRPGERPGGATGAPGGAGDAPAAPAVQGIDISKVKRDNVVRIRISKKKVPGLTEEILPQASAEGYIPAQPEAIFRLVLDLNHGTEWVPDWVMSQATPMKGDPKDDNGATFLHSLRMETPVAGIVTRMLGQLRYYAYDYGNGEFLVEYEETERTLPLPPGYKFLKRNRGGWSLKPVVSGGKVVGTLVKWWIWTDPDLVKKTADGSDTFEWGIAKQAVAVMTGVKLPRLFTNMATRLGVPRTFEASIHCTDEVKREGYCQ